MKHVFSILLPMLFTTYVVMAQPGINSKPFVLGVTEQIRSRELSESRILNIYLPEGYNQDSPTTYPVIYLLDGSADEDFIHISGLVQFFNFPWVNALPKSIVVGIANVDRKRDFTFPVKKDKQALPIPHADEFIAVLHKELRAYPAVGHSDKFIAFLEKELKPYIQKRYKTTATSTIIGQSLGGLVATEILFKKNTLFNNYIIVSPSLWWDNESLLSYRPVFTRPASVYIAVGKEGDVMENDARRLYDMLKTEKVFLRTGFGFYEHEDHASIFHLAAYDAFKFIGKK